MSTLKTGVEKMPARYLQLAANKPVLLLRLIMALLLEQEPAPRHVHGATRELNAHSRFRSLAMPGARRGARPRADVDTASRELDVYSLQLTDMSCLLCMQTATSSQTVREAVIGKEHKTVDANMQDTDWLLYSRVLSQRPR